MLTASQGNPYVAGSEYLDALVVTHKASVRHAIDLTTALRGKDDVARIDRIRSTGRVDCGFDRFCSASGYSHARSAETYIVVRCIVRWSDYSAKSKSTLVR